MCSRALDTFIHYVTRKSPLCCRALWPAFHHKLPNWSPSLQGEGNKKRNFHGGKYIHKLVASYLLFEKPTLDYPAVDTVGLHMQTFTEAGYPYAY
jgi:hypothetical protein